MRSFDYLALLNQNIFHLYLLEVFLANALHFLLYKTQTFCFQRGWFLIFGQLQPLMFLYSVEISINNKATVRLEIGCSIEST